MQQGEAVVPAGGDKEILVPDTEGCGIHRHLNVLIAELHLLHLGGGAAVPGIGDAVAAEVVVGGALAEVAAKGLEPLAVPVLFEDGLVDVIPNKAALVAGIFLVGQLGVLVEGAAGVAHGVAVFTVDEGPHVTLGQVGLNVGDLGVHPALHIGGLGIAGIPEHAFVVNQAGVIQLAHHVGHLIHGLAAKGLIAQRPDHHGGVVFVPLVGGPHPVHQHLFPLGAVVGQQEILSPDARAIGIPGAVGFLVVLGNHVQAVPVTQVVQGILVLVVAGADRIDVVLFHGLDILLDLRIGAGPAGDSAELVAVDALEHHTFAVDQHPVVLHLKLAEAHLLGPVFHRLARRIVENNLQVIEHRLFSAPEFGLIHPAAQAGALLQLHRLSEQGLVPILQGQDRSARTGCSELDIQICMGEVIPLKQGPDRQVFQMDLRDGVEPDAAEDA